MPFRRGAASEQTLSTSEDGRITLFTTPPWEQASGSFLSPLCKVETVILLSTFSLLAFLTVVALGQLHRLSQRRSVGIAAVARMSQRVPSLSSAFQPVIKLRVCVIRVGLPFAPLRARSARGVVAYTLSTRPSPLIGLSSGFVDARQSGSRAKGKEREGEPAGLPPSPGPEFFPRLPSADKQL